MKLYGVLLEVIKHHDSFWITPDGKLHPTEWQGHEIFLVDNIDKLMPKEEQKPLFVKGVVSYKTLISTRALYDSAFDQGWTRLVSSMVGGKFEVMIEHGKKINRTAMTAALEYVTDNLQHISKLWIEENSVGGKVRIFNFKKGDDNNNMDQFFNDYAKYLK